MFSAAEDSTKAAAEPSGTRGVERHPPTAATSTFTRNHIRPFGVALMKSTPPAPPATYPAISGDASSTQAGTSMRNRNERAPSSLADHHDTKRLNLPRLPSDHGRNREVFAIFTASVLAEMSPRTHFSRQVTISAPCATKMLDHFTSIVWCRPLGRKSRQIAESTPVVTASQPPPADANNEPLCRGLSPLEAVAAGPLPPAATAGAPDPRRTPVTVHCDPSPQLPVRRLPDVVTSRLPSTVAATDIPPLRSPMRQRWRASAVASRQLGGRRN